MGISFEFINKSKEDWFDYREVCTSLIEETLRQLEIDDDCELALIVVDNAEIRQINYLYRGIDRATDVISFALEDSEFIYLEGVPRMLGDIFISYEKVKEQAESYGHSLKREFCFLFVHGLLHLLGYNHESNEGEAIMFKQQEEILKAKEILR